MPIQYPTWTAGGSDDLALISELPNDLRELIEESGGFILHHGAIHFRGGVLQPEWNSLREAWRGIHALHLLYPEVLPTDIPFAQDQLGDQYLLREGSVVGLGHKLEPGFRLHAFPPFCMAESGEKTSLRPIPITELNQLHSEVAKQIRTVPDGGIVTFSIQP